MSEKYTCLICGKPITPSNTPSLFDWQGKPYSTGFPVCGECSEKAKAIKPSDKSHK